MARAEGHGAWATPEKTVKWWTAGTTMVPPEYGPIAQLGERCVRNAEVGSSILLRSTTTKASLLLALQEPFPRRSQNRLSNIVAENKLSALSGGTQTLRWSSPRFALKREVNGYVA